MLAVQMLLENLADEWQSVLLFVPAVLLFEMVQWVAELAQVWIYKRMYEGLSTSGYG